MSGKGGKRRGAPGVPTSNQIKGRVVEQLVAAMHDAPGVTVEKNVRLSPQHRAGQKREFDVLLTANVAGYPHRIAIECKNEDGPIGVEKFDAFVGKLKDVGIRQGVYVSATGYTRGAAERAKSEGIRPLILTGLTADGLAHEVEEALQSVIYLLLAVKNVAVSTETYSIEQPQELLLYYDRGGNVCGSIYDLMYIAWRRGRPPSTIGSYSYVVRIPADWHLVVDGQTKAPSATTAHVDVLGLVVSIKGTAHTHRLVNALSNDVERLHLGASFAVASARWPVILVQTEAELARVLQKESAVRVTLGRVRLPRILYNGRFWPISARAIGAMEELDSKGEVPRTGEAIAGLMRSLEGTDLHSAWEPLWSQHQAMVDCATAVLQGTDFLTEQDLSKHQGGRPPSP